MTKFHINSKGIPAPCRAKKGNCPFGKGELKMILKNTILFIKKILNFLLNFIKYKYKLYNESVNYDNIDNINRYHNLKY